MKQVIIRIKDTKGKLVGKWGYTNQAQFNYNAPDDICNCIIPGYEVEIKMGRLFSTARTFEELTENYEYIDDAVYNLIKEDYTVQYYLKQYLSAY